jgi:hypothetical protein
MTDQQGAYFVAPFTVPEGMLMEGYLAAPLPWPAFYYFGIVGKTQTSAAEPAMAVIYEWPYSWILTNEPMSKRQIEAIHAKRFSADFALSHGRHAFLDVGEGANPPDIKVATPSGDYAMDCTSLTVPGRRGVHNLFRDIKQRILESQPSRFTNLARHMIYVWFEEPGKPGATVRPFKRSAD